MLEKNVFISMKGTILPCEGEKKGDSNFRPKNLREK
jgi:hypothetical protein